MRHHLGVGAAYYAHDASDNREMLQDITGTLYWAYDGMDRMIKEEGA